MRVTTAVLVVAFTMPLHAQPARELLEKGIYAEEAQGDLPAAIGLYEQIAATARGDRETVAQAIFRLGACQLKRGHHDDAAAAFRKLAEEFPEQKSLLADARALTARALPLQPAPWGNEEILLMATANPEDWRLQVLRKGTWQGRPVTRLEHYWRWGCSVVQADPETLRPLHYESKDFWETERVQALYSTELVEIVEWENGAPKSRQLAVDRIAYDPGALVHLIRRFPLAEGFTATVAVLDLVTGIHDVRVSVDRREPLTVRAGTFEAYKVRLAFLDGFRTDYDLWYSADAHRYPLKLPGEELVKVRTDSSARVVRLQDPQLTATLKLPEGWMLTDNRPDGEPFATRMLAPEMIAAGGLVRLGADEFTSHKTPEQMAISHLEAQGRTSAHKLREGPEDVEIDGLPASRVICDTREGAVHYWLFITRGEHRIRFWFDVKKERWDEFKPIFDEMIASLKLE